MGQERGRGWTVLTWGSHAVTVRSWRELQSSEGQMRLGVQDGSLTKLAAGAGCRLGAQLELSTRVPTRGLSTVAVSA